MLLSNCIYDNISQFLNKSFLFLGCRYDSEDIKILQKLRACGNRKKQYVLEIFKPNCQYISQYDWNVIQGNFCDPPFKNNFCDVVYWSGSIEHLEKNEIPKVLKKIESLAKELVLIETVQGNYPQGPLQTPWGINKYEEHLSTLYEQDFIDWGYKTVVGGNSWESLRHIGAYKTLTK